jgi:hypothetical protein
MIWAKNLAAHRLAKLIRGKNGVKNSGRGAAALPRSLPRTWPVALQAMSYHRPDVDRFARMVRDLEQRGLSRAEIAEAAGISRATIWRLTNEPSRPVMSFTVDRLTDLHDRVVVNREDIDHVKRSPAAARERTVQAR